MELAVLSGEVKDAVGAVQSLAAPQEQDCLFCTWVRALLNVKHYI